MNEVERRFQEIENFDLYDSENNPEDVTAHIDNCEAFIETIDEPELEHELWPDERRFAEAAIKEAKEHLKLLEPGLYDDDD